MRFHYLIIALLVALTSCEIEYDHSKYDEISLCVAEKDPFAYRHCIKKRDTGCNSGDHCGTCNNSGCQSCEGNSCRTSCSGQSCNQCPNGNCCNGRNCNVCSGNKCCNSPNCNSCVNQCTVGCNTWSCQSACMQACQSPCGCNWNENNCFETCRQQCIGDNCYENCAKQCPCDRNCTGAINPTYPVNSTNPGQPIPPTNTNYTITIIDKAEKSSPVNISTVINLKNYIYNKNVINNPINVTNVNHNHVQASNQTATQMTQPKKCCYVIHPIHCFDTVEPPYKRCIRKRHWECSDICTSIVVHLVHTKETQTDIKHQVAREIIYVPVEKPQPRCGYVNYPPYIQCRSSYGLQSCGSCYVCSGQYNPRSCSLLSNCPAICRGGILPTDPALSSTLSQYANFYQNVPAGYAYAPPVQQLQYEPESQQQQQILHVAGEQEEYQLQSLPLQYEQLRQQHVPNQQ